MGCFIIWCLAFNQSTGILSYFMSRKQLRSACLTSQKWKHSASPERGPEWPLQMMASRGSNWKVKLKTIKTLEKLFCITNRHYLKKNQHNKFKITGWVLSVPAHLFTFWSLRKFWKNVLGREALSASTMAAVCSTLQMFSRFLLSKWIQVSLHLVKGSNHHSHSSPASTLRQLEDLQSDL